MFEVPELFKSLSVCSKAYRESYFQGKSKLYIVNWFGLNYMSGLKHMLLVKLFSIHSVNRLLDFCNSVVLKRSTPRVFLKCVSNLRVSGYSLHNIFHSIYCIIHGFLYYILELFILFLLSFTLLWNCMLKNNAHKVYMQCRAYSYIQGSQIHSHVYLQQTYSFLIHTNLQHS
jgi:hypothetical protein